MRFLLSIVKAPGISLTTFLIIRAAIQSVSVGSHAADFVHHDPFTSLNISNAQDVHNHLELKRKVYSALAEGDEGELSIAVPRDVVIRQSGSAAVGIASEGASCFRRNDRCG